MPKGEVVHAADSLLVLLRRLFLRAVMASGAQESFQNGLPNESPNTTPPPIESSRQRPTASRTPDRLHQREAERNDTLSTISRPRRVRTSLSDMASLPGYKYLPMLIHHPQSAQNRKNWKRFNEAVVSRVRVSCMSDRLQPSHFG